MDAAIPMLSAWLAVLLFASVTTAVNDDVPDAVGVPEIAPDEEFKLNPAGREPPLRCQEYGVVPPVAWRVAE